MELHAVICAVHSKYIHGALAPWYLKAAVTNPQIRVTVAEATVNEQPQKVLERLVALNPTVLGFSTYIWNYSFIGALLPKLRQALPNTIIIMGGPQVSYNTTQVFADMPQIDYILSGEGEAPFAAFLAATLTHAPYQGLPGLCSRTFTALPYVSGKQPPNPYTAEYVAALKGRMAYLETSRGCPFSCTFCLSGRCGAVLFFPLERAMADILTLVQAGAKTIKLVDRTFNANPARAAALVGFICENYGTKIPAGTCFHFEIAGDILSDTLITQLNQAPKGAIQVEIGLQSFHAKTLAAVNRSTNLPRLVQNIKALVAPNNVHVHMDLIAGLPHEGLADFIKGFNQGFALKPHMLQLGFLKLLPGSPMAEAPPGVFMQDPPYTVQETPWLTGAQLKQLMGVEEALDRLWNSGRFVQAVTHVLAETDLAPYDLFALVAKQVGQSAYVSLDAFTQKILTCFGGIVPPEPLMDVMIEERLSVNSSGVMPPCLHRGPTGHYLRQLDQNPATRRSPGVKRTAAFLPTKGELVWVDYRKKDPVSGRYVVQRKKEGKGI